MQVILITGMSGSGKSVALRALEDSGFYCVDNLPPELLLDFIRLEEQHKDKRLAIAIDVRSADSLHLLPSQLKALETMGLPVKSLFLDAGSDTLLRRYSETRRRHPLSGLLSAQGEPALAEAIEAERELLSDLRDQAHVIDTSFLRSAQLQTYVKTFIDTPTAPLTLVFESFAFKRGVPIDADFVFDVRMLPNPYYEAGLRALTGRDAPVQDYLTQSDEVNAMLAHIERFLLEWIPAIERDHRRYVTVAIGCTGGQHRSVYLTEQLASKLSSRWLTLRRHRELDSAHMAAPVATH